ncbi:uncharacterized protein LOC120006536 [Tripterygium wilfordii]|uniref:uncharacterized protein LOC120006536 n=1 Tax=Tripterygium wilfordii TaxID=458696 RepID=UPI0018F7F3F3|nr:uncharacterized protein LOC120006536 [Tripterygium wilfordii]
MPGRPKKKRRKELHENVVKTKLSREGRTMTCHVCKRKGHNARNKSCPGRRGASSQASDLTMAHTASQGAFDTVVAHTNATSRGIVPIEFLSNSVVATNVGAISGSGQRSEGQSTNSMAATKATYISPFHKDCRPKTKPRKRTLLSGLGLYINPDTGRSILNPGTSMSRVIDRGSQNSKTKRNASKPDS